MEEVLTVDHSNTASIMSKASLVSTSSPIDGDASFKRRPDQALYKPPRRSKNEKLSSKTSATIPSPVNDVPKSKDTSKLSKTKTTRPSAEPYVPPSRRSQTVNQESSPVIKELEVNDTDDKQNLSVGDDDEEEEWEKLLDKSDDSISKGLEEIESKFKESVQIKKPINDYSQWTVNDFQTKEADLSHILEVSNFPSTLRTEDLHCVLCTLTRNMFDIKWVDETHALVIFSDATTALDALQLVHPMFKLFPMSQASAASKKKAKSSSEFLQPFKARPQTTSLTANRRICAALGLRNPMSNDKAKSEREKIETARQRKIRDKEEQQAAWDGNISSSTTST